jgi:hypothetical protein
MLNFQKVNLTRSRNSVIVTSWGWLYVVLCGMVEIQVHFSLMIIDFKSQLFYLSAPISTFSSSSIDKVPLFHFWYLKVTWILYQAPRTVLLVWSRGRSYLDIMLPFAVVSNFFWFLIGNDTWGSHCWHQRALMCTWGSHFNHWNDVVVLMSCETLGSSPVLDFFITNSCRLCYESHGFNYCNRSIAPSVKISITQLWWYNPKTLSTV